MQQGDSVYKDYDEAPTQDNNVLPQAPAPPTATSSSTDVDGHFGYCCFV